MSKLEDSSITGRVWGLDVAEDKLIVPHWMPVDDGYHCNVLFYQINK